VCRWCRPLTVVAQTVDNAFIGARIEQMRDGIERGESISRCAAATGVFTPVVLQMINVGEETGELDNLLFEIAGMYERETDYSIKGLSAAIEPVLLAVIGVLVLLLALGACFCLCGTWVRPPWARAGAQPMATAYIPESHRPVWSTRWVEWGLLALCIAVVMEFLWRYGQQVRAQSERAAVQSTLGALRTALVLDYVHRVIPASAKPRP